MNRRDFIKGIATGIAGLLAPRGGEQVDDELERMHAELEWWKDIAQCHYDNYVREQSIAEYYQLEAEAAFKEYDKLHSWYCDLDGRYRELMSEYREWRLRMRDCRKAWEQDWYAASLRAAYWRAEAQTLVEVFDA